MPDKDFERMLRSYGIKPGDSSGSEEKKGTLDPRIRRNWEDIQTRHKYPVNAIGVRIDPKDKETLRVWRENGIDRFLKE